MIIYGLLPTKAWYNITVLCCNDCRKKDYVTLLFRCLMTVIVAEHSFIQRGRFPHGDRELNTLATSSSLATRAQILLEYVPTSADLLIILTGFIAELYILV